MIKKLIYRDTPEMLILVCISLMCIPLVFIVEACVIWGILCIVVLLVIMLAIWNAKLNTGRKFFWCKHSLFCKQKVWIVQKTFISRHNDDCPQYKLAKEMAGLLNNIPDGTVCYCCTHEVIKEHIVKKYPNSEITPIYKKNISRLKKAIKTNCCKHCIKRNCSIFKNERAQFYAIKIII